MKNLFLNFIFILQQLLDSPFLVSVHELLYRLHVLIGKGVLMGNTVDKPLYLSHVTMTGFHRRIVLRHRVMTQHKEADAIRDYHLTCHLPALLRWIVERIQRIVSTQVLVKADAQSTVAHDDTLRQGTYLCINHGLRQVGQHLMEFLEGCREFSVDIFHVSKLFLDLANEQLKRRVLIEVEKLGINRRVVHHTDVQNVLQQQSCLLRIAGIQLLQGRAVTRCQVQSLDTVIALHLNVLGRLNILGPEVPLATNAEQHTS